MKELSIEEKAKAYDKAIKRAKTKLTNEVASDIFPELKESEDKKPNGAIVMEDFNEGNGFYKVNLAYLNKEQVEDIENIIKRWNAQKYDEEAIRDCIGVILTDAQEQRFVDFNTSLKDCLAWLEKQGQTFTKKDVDDAYLKGVCDAKQEIEKQGKQNTADKIEPKFHESDWVIDKQGIVHQISNVIKNVTYNTYGYDIVGGGYFNDNTEGVRLWTIQDAKDGDVLVDENNNIGIYKEIEGICWHSYIYLGCDNRLYGFSIGGSHVQNNTKPATKEQRDILEKTMADAGYTFDFEKKELKKEEVDNLHNYLYGEQKPTEWSEEDIMRIDNIIAIIEGRGYPDYVRWLESLKERVQPKQEWSEEDEKAINDIMWIIEAYRENGFNETHIQMADNSEKWLKSIKPRSQWEPSEEQMNTLEYYMHTLVCNEHKEILFGLYADLKKLREE